MSQGVYKNKLVLHHILCGASYRQIQDIFHISPNQISKIKNHYLQTGGAYINNELNHYTVNNVHTRSLIEVYTLQDPTISCQKISNMLKDKHQIRCSTGSVWKIRNELKFSYKPPKIRTKLTEKQKKNRMQFCLTALDLYDGLGPIIFSDESKFTLESNKKWVWRRRGEYNDEIFTDRIKFPASVMIFGAIGPQYKSKLVYLDETVNSYNYIHILQDSGISSDLDTRYGRGNYTLQQDGASAHTAKVSVRNARSLFNLLDHWPSGSPDLNPIENIWGIMKKSIGVLNPKSEIELKTIINNIWENLSLDMITNCVSSFRRRLVLVANNSGSFIQHLMRHSEIDHNVTLQPTDFLERYPSLILPLFDEETSRSILINVKLKQDEWAAWEDEIMSDFIKQHGKKWSQLGQLLQRSAISVKSRFKTSVFKKSVRKNKL